MVKVVVATPFESVLDEVGLNDPPLPVLLQMTVVPDVLTGLPYWSASWAVMVTAVPCIGL